LRSAPTCYGLRTFSSGAGAALGGAYWAFYIHRNTLAYQVTLEKRVLLFWLIASGGALVCAAPARSASIHRASSLAIGAGPEHGGVDG
jgi:hypothetical protein